MSRVRSEDLILYQDESLIILNLPGRPTDGETSDPSSLLREIAPGSRVCHRVDSEMSGLLIAARTFPVFRQLVERFRRMDAQIEYHAIVWGGTAFADEEIDRPIRIIEMKAPRRGNESRSTTSRAPRFRAIVDMKRGRPARTILTTLQSGRRFSLVRCVPLTERRQQVRVHLSALGHPIVADTVYRGEVPYLSRLKAGYRAGGNGQERPVISRPALHLASVRFTLFDKEWEFTAPYPRDFAYMMKVLGKYQ